MRRGGKGSTLWVALCGMLAIASAIAPVWVTADSGEVGFTATLYSDVIRFEADGVGSLRLTIYDLSENELWSSGQVMGDFVDWDRANATGERLANGYYLYLARGWDGSDTLVLNKTGKVVLLPGDQVQLKASPTAGGTDSASDGGPDWPGDPVQPGPRAHTAGTSTFDKVGVGTTTPGCTFDVNGIFRATNTTDSVTYIRTSGTNNSARIDIAAGNGTTSLRYAYFRFSSFEASPHDWRCGMYGNKNFTIHDATNAATRFVIDTAGRVGIGTTTPTQDLVVAGSGTLDVMHSTPWIRLVDTSPAGDIWRWTATDNGTDATCYLYNQDHAAFGLYVRDTRHAALHTSILDYGTYSTELNVYGTDSATLLMNDCNTAGGHPWGWWSETDGESGFGWLNAANTGAYQLKFFDPTTNDSATFFCNLTVSGSLNVTGIKNFVADHPTDPTKVIVYTALEGPEAGTYVRGTGQLEGGQVEIALPEHFGLVTNEAGLTAQVTSSGQWAPLYVIEVTTDRLVVGCADDSTGVEFFYQVNGVRTGYEDYDVIQDRQEAAESAQGTLPGEVPEANSAGVDSSAPTTETEMK